MSQPAPASHGFNFSIAGLTGLIEAVSFLVTAVLVFLHDPKVAIDIAAIGAAAHGLGHGFKTH